MQQQQRPDKDHEKQQQQQQDDNHHTHQQDNTHQQQQWRKVLYERQDAYEDSHTGERFLQELVVNADVPTRCYSSVLLSSLPVSQQLSAATLVTGTSCHLYQASECMCVDEM